MGKRTAKNKLLPRSQQNRLHHKKVTKKETKSCLEVNEIDFTRKYTAKINYYLEVNKIDYTIRRSQKLNKFASRSSKSTSTRRALQKINLPQGHRNRPP